MYGLNEKKKLNGSSYQSTKSEAEMSHRLSNTTDRKGWGSSFPTRRNFSSYHSLSSPSKVSQ